MSVNEHDGTPIGVILLFISSLMSGSSIVRNYFVHQLPKLHQMLTLWP